MINFTLSRTVTVFCVIAIGACATKEKIMTPLDMQSWAVNKGESKYNYSIYVGDVSNIKIIGNEEEQKNYTDSIRRSLFVNNLKNESNGNVVKYKLDIILKKIEIASAEKRFDGIMEAEYRVTQISNSEIVFSKNIKNENFKVIGEGPNAVGQIFLTALGVATWGHGYSGTQQSGGLIAESFTRDSRESKALRAKIISFNFAEFVRALIESER